VKPDLRRGWRKSSYSNQGNCVELDLSEQGLLVRDSKAPEGGMLSFTDRSAAAFLAAVKGERFGR
jgi:hypothetical protein